MWWLIPIGVGVAGKLIYDYLSGEERDARDRWERKRVQVQRSVEEHRKQIEEHIAEAQQSYDFHFLTSMHHSSLIVADAAYKLLQDARTSLTAIGKLIVAAREKRDSLEKEVKGTRDRTKKLAFRDELKEVVELRRAFFNDKDKVKEQRDGLYSEVKRLNAQTAELKHFIRDRCGRKGNEWYDRLEERKKQRRIAEGKPV